MKLLISTLFSLLIFSCTNGGSKGAYELKYDSIQVIFKANPAHIADFIALEEEDNKLYVSTYYDDLTKLSFDSMLTKYNIQDEAFFLSSISLTSQGITLKNSLQNLSTSADNILLNIADELDTLVPLHLEDDLKFEKLE